MAGCWYCSSTQLQIEVFKSFQLDVPPWESNANSQERKPYQRNMKGWWLRIPLVRPYFPKRCGIEGVGRLDSQSKKPQTSNHSLQRHVLLLLPPSSEDTVREASSDRSASVMASLKVLSVLPGTTSMGGVLVNCSTNPTLTYELPRNMGFS